MKFKKITALVLSVLMLASFAGCTQSDDNNSKNSNKLEFSDSQISDIKSTIDTKLNKLKFSGTAYAAMDKQEVFFGSYGYKDWTKKSKIAEDNIYQLASVSKIVTGAAVMQLVSQKKLSLNDTLDKFFKGGKYLKTIKIKNLLDMTAGFGDYTKDIEKDTTLKKIVKKDPYSYKICNHIIAKILRTGTEYEPGIFHYSNSGYYLLSRIVGTYSKNGYMDYVTKNIFEPLNMKNTKPISQNDYIAGYDVKAKKWYTPSDNKVLNSSNVMYGSMGIVSTVEDINKLLDAMFDGTFTNGKSYIDEVRKSDTGYNYGFYFDKNTLYAEGTSAINSTYIILNTKYTERVILMSNYIEDDRFSTTAQDILNAMNSKINGMLLNNI